MSNATTPPAPVLAASRPRVIEGEDIDVPADWLFCDYLPARPNNELARDMQAGRKPLRQASKVWNHLHKNQATGL